MKKQNTEYFQLRDQIDQLTGKLSSLHQNQMQCKKGCDLCCMNYNIFPIEFHAIKEQLKKQAVVNSRVANENECVFLIDHECQIYENRPVICRTHGLPLLFMNDEQWELSACELNFTTFDDEDFDTENTYPQDKFNSKLFILNKNFIKENNLPYSEFDLIPLRMLAQDDETLKA